MKRNTKDVKLQCPRDTLMELLRARCIFVEFVISARAAICLLYAIVLIVFRSVGEDLKGFQNNADVDFQHFIKHDTSTPYNAKQTRNALSISLEL